MRNEKIFAQSQHWSMALAVIRRGCVGIVRLKSGGLNQEGLGRRFSFKYSIPGETPGMFFYVFFPNQDKEIKK